MVKVLIEATQQQYQSNYGDTNATASPADVAQYSQALTLAAVHNAPDEVITCLLNAGAEPNRYAFSIETQENFYALHWAVVNNNVEAVNSLLAYNADPAQLAQVKWKDKKGQDRTEQKSALDLAIDQKNWDLVFVLCNFIQQQNRLNPQQNRQQQQVIYAKSLRAALDQQAPLSVITRLIDLGADLTAKGKKSKRNAFEKAIEEKQWGAAIVLAMATYHSRQSSSATLCEDSEHLKGMPRQLAFLVENLSKYCGQTDLATHSVFPAFEALFSSVEQLRQSGKGCSRGLGKALEQVSAEFFALIPQVLSGSATNRQQDNNYKLLCYQLGKFLLELDNTGFNQKFPSQNARYLLALQLLTLAGNSDQAIAGLKSQCYQFLLNTGNAQQNLPAILQGLTALAISNNQAATELVALSTELHDLSLLDKIYYQKAVIAQGGTERANYYRELHLLKIYAPNAFAAINQQLTGLVIINPSAQISLNGIQLNKGTLSCLIQVNNSLYQLMVQARDSTQIAMELPQLGQQLNSHASTVNLADWINTAVQPNLQSLQQNLLVYTKQQETRYTYRSLSERKLDNTQDYAENGNKRGEAYRQLQDYLLTLPSAQEKADAIARVKDKPIFSHHRSNYSINIFGMFYNWIAKPDTYNLLKGQEKELRQQAMRPN